MSFNVGDTASDAVERVTTSAAGVLIAGLTLVGVAQTAALQTILSGFLEWMIEVVNDPEFNEELSASEVETIEEELNAAIANLPLALDLSPGAAALLWLAAFLVSLVIVVIAIDTFANERDSFDGLETEGLGRKTLHLLLGWIAFAVLFVIGSMLIVGGLLVALFLAFFTAAIVVDDESFVGAFSSSYGVVRSNILGTIGLLLLGGVAFGACWFAGGIVATALPAVPGEIANQLVTAVGQVFVIALVTCAYVDATRDDATTSDHATGERNEEPLGGSSAWDAEPESSGSEAR